MSSALKSTAAQMAHLEDLLERAVDRYPEHAEEAAAIREAFGHLSAMQKEAHALVASGGTIEELRKLAFEGAARAAAVIQAYNRKHDPARALAAH